MSISILYFGATADITGQRSVEIDVAQDTKAHDVFEKLVNAYPLLAKHRLHISVNQQYATGEEILKDGDELAIFTAVSGG